MVTSLRRRNAMVGLVAAAVPWLVACRQGPGAPAGVPAGLPKATVTRVVDGDTIDIRLSGATARVRLVGVDTPESVDPRRPVQCFGREAASFAKERLSGRTVYLESDQTQGDRDEYGRWLRYVWLETGVLFNQHLIEQGYAHEYTFRLPYKYQAQFRQAEREAREHERGLWAPQTCAGDTRRPAGAGDQLPSASVTG